jgi:hypothetical protein
MGLGWNVLKATVYLQPDLLSRCKNERMDECDESMKKERKGRKVTKIRKILL